MKVCPVKCIYAFATFGQISAGLMDLFFLRVFQDEQEAYSLQMKARVLSRKVWELLMLLPTNTDMLVGFQTVALKDGPQKTEWAELLDPHGTHKLMYSLQIVESLSRAPKHRKCSTVSLYPDFLRHRKFLALSLYTDLRNAKCSAVSAYRGFRDMENVLR